MDQLKKPRFFNFNSWNNIFAIVGTLLGIVQFFIPDNVLELKYKIIIALSISLFCFFTYLVFYIVSVNKFYKNYLKFYKEYNDLQTRHVALSEQFNDKIKTIKEKDDLITEYKYVLSKTKEHIANGILPVNDYEKIYLENLYKVIYEDIEHLNYKEGGK